MTQINRCGIECTEEDLKDSRKLVLIWKQLRDKRQFRLLALVTRTFVGSSMYGTINQGFAPLKVDAYAAIKPREGGLFNCFRLSHCLGDIAEDASIPLQAQRLSDRLNEKKKQYYAITFRVRFLEMLSQHLQKVGTEITGTVQFDKKNQQPLLSIEGFRVPALIRGAISAVDSPMSGSPEPLIAGTAEAAVVIGFSLSERRFIVSLKRAFA